MEVKCGKVHKYLGITLDYYAVCQVNITMLDYINEKFDAFEKADPTGGSTKSSSALDIRFKVELDCKN